MPTLPPTNVAIFIIAALSVAFRGVTPTKAFAEARSFVKTAETETPGVVESMNDDC